MNPTRTFPIKTVLVLQDLEFGGSQRYALHLLDHLDRTLFDLELWVLRGGDDMAPLASASGVKVVTLTRSPEVTPKALFRLYLKLKAETPGILYAITGVPVIWGRIFGAILGIPLVVTSRRGYRDMHYETLMWSLSDLIITNADALKRDLVNRCRVDPGRIEVIPNGVEQRHFKPSDSPGDPHPTIVQVARLVNEKDPLTLLRAFKLVLKRIPDARLIVVGDGYLRTQFCRFINANSLGRHVTHLAGARDVRPYLERAWVFCLSSRSEGFPNAVLEAMSAGLPVVVTEAGGAPEPVVHGVTGLVVPPEAPEALATALIKLLNDPELRSSMGIMARKRAVERYSLREVVRLTEQALLKAAGVIC